VANLGGGSPLPPASASPCEETGCRVLIEFLSQDYLKLELLGIGSASWLSSSHLK
jgi:hypothetical protein